MMDAEDASTFAPMAPPASCSCTDHCSEIADAADPVLHVEGRTSAEISRAMPDLVVSALGPRMLTLGILLAVDLVTVTVVDAERPNQLVTTSRMV
jgi:hypothetical protein